ncbi:MAG: phosphonoacetaldehyde reductase [Ruminococcus sp.]|uniref:phosphonoacetaldehyde reductase n=1 Tax=Ruminococcus sp. TaxID=41978 RepID=UPI0025CC17DC|nr:phosphonoacetaldehyde reductase [Ruminococcus sp.]MCR5600116.1 phosphonoacetaldehyde reductase [Ruminococcus sp.]
MQEIMKASENYSELDEYFSKSGAERIMLVCGASIEKLRINEYFETLEKRSGIKVVRFSDFQPNPRYESVVEGVRAFREHKCELIAAVGGGSALDTAKCIKLYSNMDDSSEYIKQTIIPNDVPFIAVPTTAGTGSEANHFAVIYLNGEKQSVADDSCIPSAVLFDASALRSLPVYQKKATMMDALCHAVEAYWSVNSTDESMEYSRSAIKMIIANKDRYLVNDDDGNTNMLKAANIAGKAINITRTTAGHAMCYKLTTLYGISHGHAAALCNMVLIPHMLANISKCSDMRGTEHLGEVLSGIAEALGCGMESLPQFFSGLVSELGLAAPKMKSDSDIDILKKSVDPVRLRNHPVSLSAEDIEKLYRQILMQEQ